MNRGNIPGFYYDEDKKKYFKIQANHLVPQYAKYSKGNVKRENRQSKKRKIDEKKRVKRYRQSVKPSPTLQHPVASGIGLLREHGSSSVSQSLDQRDAALVSNWRPKRTAIKYVGYPDESNYTGTLSHYCPATQQMIFA